MFRLLLAACAFAGVCAPASAAQLAATDLEAIYVQAADRAAEISPVSVIAIVDRDGRELLLRRTDGAAVGATERAVAVSKAGTAVFLSSNDHAFSPRTAGFIIQQNFPPRVRNRPPGPLVGVGFSNLAYSDVNYFRETGGARIPGTRLYGSPGGVPLYKAGELVAGIGVTGDGTEQEDSSIRADKDEMVALAGQIGYAPRKAIHGSRVTIDGIRVPYVASSPRRARVSVTTPPGPVDPPPAPVEWPAVVLGGVLGEERAAIHGDPSPGDIGGQPRLTEAEVRMILANAAARTLVTRAGIRLPAGRKPARVFITVVNNPDQPGVAPEVLGTFRTPDTTMFSWDVSAQKARTALYFSDNTRAYSTRTVGFLAQSMFPPGIVGTAPGPLNGLQETFSLPLLSGFAAPEPRLPNGITIFPGGFPLYRNGVLIGAIGVSGDGVDQDDLIGISGTAGFEPPLSIRADMFFERGARLPYAKFPRSSELRPPLAPVPPGFVYFQADYFSYTQIVTGLFAGPAEDPDGDAIDNLHEYAFALDPLAADPASEQPVVALDVPTQRLTITFTRDETAIDLVYTVEASNDGVVWTPIARATAGGPVQNLGGALSVAEAGPNPFAVLVVDGVTVTDQPLRALRLTVTRP